MSELSNNAEIHLPMKLTTYISTQDLNLPQNESQVQTDLEFIC